MPSLSTLAAAIVLALLLYFPGWATARAFGVRADLFARLWCGLGATSIVGLVLAEAGVFSLTALTGTLALLSGAGALISGLRARRGRNLPAAVATGARLSGGRGVRALACAAGIGAALWCWPPFETVIAASDSTMYVNAGIHLARTGTLAVEDTVVAMLLRSTARAIFSPLGWWGPFIRLPGGLLLPDLAGGAATPAFFPLLPVWTAVAAAVGGPEAVPAVAPLFAGLAVWAVVLFAGETFGLCAAAATSVFFIANFALWWFGRFLMPETLTCALIWGGFVFLARAGGTRAGYGWALLAGILLGVAGLARTETFLFLAAAGALWMAWSERRALALAAAAGFVLTLVFGVGVIAAAPSHHLAYLRSDIAVGLLMFGPRLAAAWSGPLPGAASALVTAIVVGAGFLGRRRGTGFVNGALGGATLIAVAATVLVYASLGVPRPLRHIGWLAAYCSPVLVALAVPGSLVAWRRGGPALRLAAIAWLLVAVVFVLNPRVSAYQPWAIRRFLPIVIPGLTVAAAAALALLAAAPGRAVRLAALVAALSVAVIEVRPVLAVRQKPYFAGSFEAVRGLAGVFAPGALVVIDSSFADVQLQVPLWLVHGRETLMVRGGSLRWRSILAALIRSGRPVYWVTNRYAPAPRAFGLVFRIAAPDRDIAVKVPDSPVGVPPTHAVTRIVPLRIYRVSLAGGFLRAPPARQLPPADRPSPRARRLRQ